MVCLEKTFLSSETVMVTQHCIELATPSSGRIPANGRG